MNNKIGNKVKAIYLYVFTILFFMFSVTSITYAYYAINATDDDTIVGVAGTADISLDVSKITPANNTGNMVPQLESALGNAVSSTYNCVDDNDNVVCHVYKIDVTNIGTANVKLKGTIIFTNPNDLNLKYKIMSSATSIGTNTSYYGYTDMETPLVKDVSLEVDETKTYYMVVWIDETEGAQNEGGTYTGIVKFENDELDGVTSTYVNYLINSSTSNFKSDTYKEKIKNISFVDYIDTTNAVASWDMGTLQDGSIIAWLNDNSTEGYYDLYIGSYDVIMGANMSSFFDGMSYVDSINFDNLDTSEVTNMYAMFQNTGKNSSVFALDLGDKFDTGNVTNMGQMFYDTGCNSIEFTLDLGDKFDTSNVTSMAYMFVGTGQYSNKFVLDLGDKFNTGNVITMRNMFTHTGGNSEGFLLYLGDKFDTSNVTNMLGMFSSTGATSTNFVLDLGDKFDTGKVIDMSKMFYGTGKLSTLFTLNLGNKFDTSNVTNMTSMFYGVGASNITFTLDLGDKFDTGKVNDMSNMFYATGLSSKVFTLDLGDKFNTSNVTNMSMMFYNTGNKSEIFTLDLGDKFDTSSVLDMNCMFYTTGSSSEVFTLDLGDEFDTSNVTNMSHMFASVGESNEFFTIDLGNKFYSNNVTNMSNMFNSIGLANSSFELDIGNMTFDSVTTYNGMFRNFKDTQKIYVKSSTEQAWILDNISDVSGTLTSNNVLIKN